MFAILLTRENEEKILQSGVIHDADLATLEVYLRNLHEWYLVRGYVDDRGRLMDWTVLPAYRFTKNFEHNPDKIQTDWDMIVRKN